jgi:hypothetical protein
MAATIGDQALHLVNNSAGRRRSPGIQPATGSAVRAELRRIKPDIPVLLFTGVGIQTPFLLRFFDSSLQNAEPPEEVFEELDA